MGQPITESEASNKWCPQTLVARTIQHASQDDLPGAQTIVVVNRDPSNRDPFVGSHCVGSNCMHWSWLEGRGSTKKGYCGLSGKQS